MASTKFIALPLIASTLASSLKTLNPGTGAGPAITVFFDPSDANVKYIWAGCQTFSRFAAFHWAPVPDVGDDDSIKLCARLMLLNNEETLEQLMLGFLEPSGDKAFALQTIKAQLETLKAISQLASAAGAEMKVPSFIWKSAKGGMNYYSGASDKLAVALIVKDSLYP